MDNALDPTAPRSGARILVAALLAHGVDRVFCIPGESYLAVLDAFHDTPQIQVLSCRHEGAAAHMAEADGKLTGRPGICFVTRGPGATHASVGVHTAMQDSTPMILFIGQVSRRFRDREAFQEIDYRGMFGPLAKWVVEIDDPARIPEIVSRAFHMAVSGRMGPVVIALPEDVLTEECVAEDAEQFVRARSGVDPADLYRVSEAFSKATRPLVIVGGSGWTSEAGRALAALAERLALPVAASFRRQDLLDNEHPAYVGHLGLGPDPKLAARVRDADLLLVMGARLGETTTSGYSLLHVPTPRQFMIHVHPDPEELGRVYRAQLQIPANVSTFVEGLAQHGFRVDIKWRAWSAELRRDYEAFSAASAITAPPQGVDLARAVVHIRERLGSEVIVANGAGNYTVWVHRFHRYRALRTELAPTSGAMGYGVPAAIAAKLRHPDRPVVCFAGDGCFLMYPQELATAVQAQANVLILIVNNGQYGTIRMHQERHYPGRPIATTLRNPDFAALAQSFGAFGESVETFEEFESALERALAAGKPAVLELRTDPRHISPSMRI